MKIKHIHNPPFDKRRWNTFFSVTKDGYETGDAREVVSIHIEERDFETRFVDASCTCRAFIKGVLKYCEHIDAVMPAISHQQVEFILPSGKIVRRKELEQFENIEL